MISSLSPFEKAVAGSTPFMFAQDFPGKVFKPAHPREKEFYDSLEKHPQLKKLVPKYYGTLTLKPSVEFANDHTPIEYLVLEDLTHGFVYPCILDVKLGITHHDIDASSAVTARSSKYISAPALGFCLTGMQVFKVTNGEFNVMDKSEGRDLTEHTIAQKLYYFFHDGNELRQDVITLLLQKLHQVELYFENQPAYTFRSTSLLLLYEGAYSFPATTPITNSSPSPSPVPDNPPHVDVRLIDFAHARQNSAGNADEYGYLFGTKNLTRILKTLLTSNNSTEEL